MFTFKHSSVDWVESFLYKMILETDFFRFFVFAHVFSNFSLKASTMTAKAEGAEESQNDVMNSHDVREMK